MRRTSNDELRTTYAYRRTVLAFIRTAFSFAQLILAILMALKVLKYI